MDRIVKVGIIGCGGIANGKHMPSLSKLPNVRMVAFCDDSCTIVFYGLFIPDNSVHLNKDSSPTTFDEHLKYFYDDWYDFFS